MNPQRPEAQPLARFVEATGAPAHHVAPAPVPTLPLVTFALAGELYALPVQRVREVVRADGISRVPQAPEHVRGVKSVRGRVLPVLEVRTRLALPALEPTPAARVLIVEGRGRLLGLLVDEVHKVTLVPTAAVTEPPPEVRSRLSRHVTAVVQLTPRVALLLDVDALLLLPEVSPREPAP